MHNHNIENKKPPLRKPVGIISNDKFLKELGLIVNYPDAFRKEAKFYRGYWAFSYLLCSTWWQASGFCSNEFSSLFSCSSRPTGFINEHQCHTRNSGKSSLSSANQLKKQTNKPK